MTTDITTTKDFQTSMFERIRDQMGDLLTEEDMRRLIEQAVQKAFFEERIERKIYGSDVRHPAAFVEMVRDASKPMIQAAVDKWVAENKDKLAEKIDAIVRDGVAGVLVSHINSRFQEPLSRLSSELHSKGLLK